jgi:hypothetical protein
MGKREELSIWKDSAGGSRWAYRRTRRRRRRVKEIGMLNESNQTSSELAVVEKSTQVVVRKDANIQVGIEQQQVLELLLAGKSVASTAAAAGVSRATIYRWLKHDPVFLAAYNQWHDQIQESCRSRLMLLQEKAIDTVERTLEKGDGKVAMQLLKGMGVIGAKPVGAIDAQEASERIDLDKEKRRVDLEFDKWLLREQEDMIR